LNLTISNITNNTVESNVDMYQSKNVFRLKDFLKRRKNSLIIFNPQKRFLKVIFRGDPASVTPLLSCQADQKTKHFGVAG
jgi:hypothetical protein